MFLPGFSSELSPSPLCKCLCTFSWTWVSLSHLDLSSFFSQFWNANQIIIILHIETRQTQQQNMSSFTAEKLVFLGLDQDDNRFSFHWLIWLSSCWISCQNTCCIFLHINKSLPSAWILGKPPPWIPTLRRKTKFQQTERKYIYTASSLPEKREAAGSTDCLLSSVKLHIFPRPAVTSWWWVCLFWHPGQDVTALTAPRPISQSNPDTHTQAHNYLFYYWSTEDRRF